MSKAMLMRMFLARSEIIDGTRIRQFRTENAKSDRSKCQICSDKIDLGEVRISRLDDYSGIDRWHHVHCFIVAAPDLDFHTDVENLQAGVYILHFFLSTCKLKKSMNLLLTNMCCWQPS